MNQTSYDMSNAHSSSRFTMSLFTVEEFYGFWPMIEDMLDCVPHTWRHWTKEEIYSRVASNTMQAWGIGPPPQATVIILTMIYTYPAMRVFSPMWIAGTLDDGMLPLMDATFVNYAKMNGCDEIEFQGRPGWERKLKTLGYTRTAITLTRPIHNNRMN